MVYFQPNDVERLKVITQYFTDLTSLSTWAILLIATFLEKLFQKPEWKNAVIVSLAGFITSVFSSVIVQTFMIFFAYPGRNRNPTSDAAFLVPILCFIASVLGFLVGVLGLGLFTIKNVSKKLK